MPPKRKVMSLEEQTKLSFASQCQQYEGQEPATATEKDDATTTAQTKFRERKFFEPWLKQYSWMVYEKNGYYTYNRYVLML